MHPKLMLFVPLFHWSILGTVKADVVTVFKTIQDVDGTVVCRTGRILMEEFTVRSAIECSKVCAESELCVGFNFRNESKTCSLFPAGHGAFTREEQCRYSQVRLISMNIESFFANLRIHSITCTNHILRGFLKLNDIEFQSCK